MVNGLTIKLYKNIRVSILLSLPKIIRGNILWSEIHYFRGHKITVQIKIMGQYTCTCISYTKIQKSSTKSW